MVFITLLYRTVASLLSSYSTRISQMIYPDSFGGSTMRDESPDEKCFEELWRKAKHAYIP